MGSELSLPLTLSRVQELEKRFPHITAFDCVHFHGYSLIFQTIFRLADPPLFDTVAKFSSLGQDRCESVFSGAHLPPLDPRPRVLSPQGPLFPRRRKEFER